MKFSDEEKTHFFDPIAKIALRKKKA